MDKKVPLYTLPEPSTALYSSGTKLEVVGGKLTLAFDYYRLREEQIIGVFQSGLRFLRVRAYCHRALSHCTLWHVQDAYDTLVEVQGSSWLTELQANFLEHYSHLPLMEIHHYMIFFAEDGCYEIAAQAWEIVPEIEQ